MFQADLEDHSNELKMAEDNAKKAMADAAKLSEELRHEQEHSSSIEKLRRTLESQVKELQVRPGDRCLLHSHRPATQPQTSSNMQSTVNPSCLSVTSRCSIETDGRIELVFGKSTSFDLSYTTVL